MVTSYCYNFQSNKAQRILYAKILVQSVRTIGCRYNSFQNSIFCPTISNVCPVLTHSRLTCFSRTLSSFSVLYVHPMLRFLYTAPDKCKSEPTVKAKIALPWKYKKVECVFYEAVSAHALEITGSLETFSDIIWIQATKMVQHGDNCVYYGFIHHQMSGHQLFWVLIRTCWVSWDLC